MNTYCGYVEIVGRPNVGKSTLFNKLICKKLSIVSNKPQTTWCSIIGVYTSGLYQIIYKDNPGMVASIQKRMLYQMQISGVNIYDFLIKQTTLVIFVVEGINWTNDDQVLLNKLRNIDYPIILLINKVDTVFNKQMLLPHIQFLNSQVNFYATFPVCIKKDIYPTKLVNVIKNSLPIAQHRVSAGYFTDSSEEFIASEIIREKLMWFLDKELPYFTKVNIDFFVKNSFYGYRIYGSILVKRENHKKIIIGKQGCKIRQISLAARQDMEILFKTVVYLKVWVKTKYEKCIIRMLRTV